MKLEPKLKRPTPAKDILTGKVYKDYMQAKQKDPNIQQLLPFLQDDDEEEKEEQCGVGIIPRPCVIKKLKRNKDD